MADTLMLTSFWWALERAATFDPAGILSLMDPGSPYSVPSGPSFVEHIRLEFHDVVSDSPKDALRVAPSIAHVQCILDFAKRWDGRTRVLVHCTAGVSRSPAAAIAILSARNPGQEREIARLLRIRAPWVNPNLRIIRLADDLLGRRGALIRAVVGMGQPSMHGLTEPVLLPGFLTR